MTTRDAILNLLRSGPKTSWELCQGAKTSRYGGRIFELRKMGYVIQIKARITAMGERIIVQKIYRLVSEPTVQSLLEKKVINPLIDSLAKSITGKKAQGYKFKQGRLF